MSSTILSRRLRVGRQLGRGAAGVVRQAVLTIATGYARNPRHMGGIHTQTNDGIGGANTAASQDENSQFGGSPTSNADVSPSENSPSMSTNSRLVSGAESYRSGGVEVATTKASSNGDSEQASCNSPIPTASKAMDPSDESGRVGREGHSARVIDVPLRRRRANSCCVAEHYLSHAPEKTSAAQQSVSHISFEVAVKIQRQSIGLCIREIWASHCLSSRRAALRVARRRLIEDLWNPNARGSVARQDSTHHLTESCFSESPALECAPTWWCGMPFFAGPSVSTGTHTGSVSLDMDRQFATVKEPTAEFNYSKRHASHGVDVELASVAAACCPQEKTNTNGPTSTDMKGSRHISKLGSRSSFTSRIAASLSKLGGRTSFVSRGFNPDGELHHHLLAATGSITATVPEYSVLYRTSDLLGLVAAEGINLYESLRRKRRRFLPDLTTPFSGDELENVRDRFDFMHETRYSLTMLAEDMPIAAAERWANLMKIAPLHCQQKVPHQNMEVIIGSAWLSPHELHFYSALGIVEEEQDAAQGDESEAEKALAFSRLPPHLAIAATEGNEAAEQWLHDWLSSASGAEQREPAPFTKSSDHSGSSFRTTIDDDDDQEQQVEGGLDLDNTPLYAENLSQKLLRQQLAEKLQHNENNETAFVAAAIMPTVPCAINLHSLLNDMFLARQRRPSSEVTLFLVYQLCDLVAVVHEAGLVHGDVKPDNFLVFSMETLAQRSQVPSRGRSRESRRGISRLASRTAQHGSTVYAKLLRKSSATSSASSHSRPVCGAKSASLTSPPPAAPLLSTRSSVVSTTRNAARKRRDVPTLFRAASADASHPTEHHLKHPKSPNSSERIYRPHHHNDAKPSSPNHHAASRISASDLRHPSLKASSPSIRRPPPPTWGQHFPSSSNSSPLNINKEGTTASGDWRDNHPLLPCRRKVPVGVAGIDLGRALDVQEVYKGTLFTGECHVADFKPPMMLEWKKSDTASKNYEQVVKSDGVNLPPRRNQADVPGWLHHIDTFGIAGIAHCLLFGKYLKIRKIGPGAYPTRQAAADAQSGLARYGNDSKCEGLRVCGSTVDCGVAPQLPTRDCADCRSIRYGMSETIKRSVQDSDFWRDFFDALINFAPLRIAGAAKGPSAPGLEFPDVGTQIGQMSALLLRQVQWRIEQIFVEDRSRSERLHADLTSLNSLVKAHAVVAARRGG